MERPLKKTLNTHTDIYIYIHTLYTFNISIRKTSDPSKFTRKQVQNDPRGDPWLPRPLLPRHKCRCSRCRCRRRFRWHRCRRWAWRLGPEGPVEHLAGLFLNWWGSEQKPENKKILGFEGKQSRFDQRVLGTWIYWSRKDRKKSLVNGKVS